VNYELARELKVAGFPRKDPLAWDLWEYATDGKPGTYIGAPTLEELIEACGKDFQELQRSRSGTWDAFGHKAYGKAFIGGTSDTPTEAVARLWLALNHTVFSKS
jgi:hypothetical protein